MGSQELRLHHYSSVEMVAFVRRKKKRGKNLSLSKEREIKEKRHGRSLPDGLYSGETVVYNDGQTFFFLSKKAQLDLRVENIKRLKRNVINDNNGK